MSQISGKTPDGWNRLAPRLSDLVSIAGQVFEESGTEKAFRFHDGRVTVWLPRSLCEWDPSDKTMAMPEWLAKEKGLV